MGQAHEALFNTFMQSDPHSIGLAKLLNDIYPAFERQLFHNNDFMRKLVMSGYNPLDILDYPICGRCETLAPWNTPVKLDDGAYHKRCTCMANKCNHTTIDPITLREWMKEELKHKAPPDIAEIAEIAVDLTAARMMKIAYDKYNRIVNGRQSTSNNSIILANGKEHKV